MANIRVSIRVKLPWWWRLYMAAAMFFEATIGGIDPKIAGEFISKHVRVELKDLD